MVVVEIILILIGVAFLIGSHFVQERFSEKDLQEIAKMSETQLNIIVEKQVKSARTQVENSVEEIIDESLEITQRGLEKETNEKIMAVSEYSDTILETMNKTHNEIMFLYSMLNDKQTELTELMGEMHNYTPPKMEVPSNTEATTDKEFQMLGLAVEGAAEPIPEETPEATQESMFINKNEQILMLHKEGKNEVEIAKALDCGLGEVRLVLGLFVEEG